MLLKCMLWLGSGSVRWGWLRRICLKGKLIVFMLSKLRNLKKKRNGRKLRRCISLSKSMIWLLLCTKNVGNMTTWFVWLPSTEAIFSNKLTLLWPKSSTRKETTNWLNHIIFQQEPGVKQLKCTNLKDSGKRLWRHQNCTEKTNTHVNWPKDGQKLWVQIKASKCYWNWTSLMQLLNTWQIKNNSMRLSKWPQATPSTKLEMCISNMPLSLKIKADIKKLKESSLRPVKLWKLSVCMRMLVIIILHSLLQVNMNHKQGKESLSTKLEVLLKKENMPKHNLLTSMLVNLNWLLRCIWIWVMDRKLLEWLGNTPHILLRKSWEGTQAQAGTWPHNNVYNRPEPMMTPETTQKQSNPISK